MTMVPPVPTKLRICEHVKVFGSKDKSQVLYGWYFHGLVRLTLGVYGLKEVSNTDRVALKSVKTTSIRPSNRR